MLPRQRRAGVATDGARRERMRPWQRPESGCRTWCSVSGPRASAPKSTEARIPRVGFPRTSRRNGPDPATAGTSPGRAVRMSANPSAQPRPTGDIRPISGGAGTDQSAHHGHECTYSYRYAPCCRTACGTPRPSPPKAGRSPWNPPGQRGPRRHHARSGRRSPPPGPVRRLRGMRRRCSPSPPCPVQRADPRSTHASAPAGTGPERTAGRTATRPVHAAAPRTRAPAKAPEAVRAGRRTHPGARVLTGRRATGGPTPPVPAHSGNPVPRLGCSPPGAAPAISARGRGGAPQTLPRAPAFSPRFLRPSFARHPPPARPLRLSRHSRRPASWRPPRVAGTDNNPAIRTSGP